VSRFYDCGDYDNWSYICFAGALRKTIDGKRGQEFLKKFRDILAAMPEKKLINGEITNGRGCFCALGAALHANGVEVKEGGFGGGEDYHSISTALGISPTLATQIAFVNDEVGSYYSNDYERFRAVEKWVNENIKEDQ